MFSVLGNRKVFTLVSVLVVVTSVVGSAYTVGLLTDTESGSVTVGAGVWGGTEGSTTGPGNANPPGKSATDRTPSSPCLDDEVLLVKYEFEGGKKSVDKGNDSTVSVTPSWGEDGPDNVSYTSDVGPVTVVVKGGQSLYNESGVESGTVGKSDTNGKAVSFVAFCQEPSSTETETDTPTTETETPTTETDTPTTKTETPTTETATPTPTTTTTATENSTSTGTEEE